MLVALQPVISRLLESPAGGQVAGDRPAADRGGGRDHAEPVADARADLRGVRRARWSCPRAPTGIRQLRGAQGDSLADNASFAPGGLREFLDRASSVVFLDLRRLSALVERAGLAATPAYRAIESDIARIGAVSGVTASERSSQTAQIFVEVP